ncbi:hypothetical protein V6N12_023480 [Hibiscus sabdariffa]|uniref:Uncharacterized protein n=1 Tax=Hibiscus sabdariffa TaxID=183260 RepID=A0ABR2FY71_9ROSI
MKSEKEKSKHESKKKKMKEPQRVQSSNKRGSSSKKAYVATWSDEEDSTEENEAHLCFMALQEGEDHRYRYSRVSTDTQGMVPILQNPVPIPLSIFLSHMILVAIWRTDTQGEYRYPCHEYRYPLHQKGSNGWKISPMAPNNSQRSPTARYSIGTIKQASKHQEKANVSL